MAKKAVASLQSKSKRLTKAIKMVKSSKSGAYTFVETILPPEKVNEFFGFYAFAGKATSFLGPFLFGLITSLFNQQIALWVVVLLFLIGFLLFNKIKLNDERFFI